MFEFLERRLKEPSTYAGLSAVLVGAGQLGKVDEAPAIAEAVMNAGSAVVGGGGWIGGLMAFAAGLAAIFVREQGGNKNG